jgi:hypothetical protein
MDRAFKEPLRYWAFISYSRHDRRTARWCRDALSRQRVPRELRPLVAGHSNRLAPVFLDEESAAAAPVLTDELRASLRGSKHLIVICSPFAVASQYVADEIRYFQSLGRSNGILCLIASGVPNSADQGQPQLECFPEPLRYRTNGSFQREVVPLDQRPLGAALGDETATEKARAIRQLTAGVLGVSDSSLRRAEMRRIAAYAAGAILAIALLVATLAAFVVPWKTYARSYNRRRGVWEEVDRIGSRRANLIGEHFEFVRRGVMGKPRAVRLVDGFGHCPRSGMLDILRRSLDDECTAVRACEAEFIYGQNGSIEKEVLKDQYGNPLETLTYVSPSNALFTEARGFCSRSKSGINLVSFERYDNGPQAGLDHKISFWDQKSPSQMEPRVNDDGAFGIEYEYSPEGRETRVSFVSATNQPQIGRQGFHSYGMTYDASGTMVERKYFSSTGQPVMTQGGYAAERFGTDRFGRRTSLTYLDLSGKPVPGSDGIAGIRWSWGNRGEALKTEYLDPDGVPAANQSGIARLDLTFDAHGDDFKLAHFGTNGQPTTDQYGVAGQVRKFDSYHTIVEFTELGVDGRSTFNKDGYVTEQRTYDNSGNLSEHSFHGLNGELIREKGGVSIVRQRFDEQHRRTAIDFLDPLGKPTLSDGYAGRRLEYDSNGNPKVDAYVGIDGLSTLNNDGWQAILSNVNDAGLVTEERYVGLNGKPATTNYGCSVIKYEYDHTGREIKRSFHDWDGNLAVTKYGVAGWTMRYDTRGREIELAYFGKVEQPARESDGAFIYSKQYNDRGNLVGEEYLDANRRRMLNNSGYAVAKYDVDRFGSILRARYLGIGSQTVLATDGTAGWNATYDTKGQQLSKENVGLRDELVAGKNDIVRWVKTYDGFGNVTQIRFESAKGEPALSDEGLAGWRSSYDDRREETERMFMGLDGKPSLYKKGGYATWKAKYDDRGRNIETSYYGLDGRMVLAQGGYAVARSVYDERGNTTEVSLFDDQNRPAHLWAARSTHQYDQYGREVEVRFYDAQDRLSRHPKSGRAIVKRQYDDAGRLSLEESFDEHDALVDRRDLGYARKIVKYDASGAELDQCVKTNGKIVKPCPKE